MAKNDLEHTQYRKPHASARAHRNVSCCIACINWIRRMEIMEDGGYQKKQKGGNDGHGGSSSSRPQLPDAGNMVFRGKTKNTLVIPMDHLLLFLGDPGTPVLGDSNPDRR